MTGRPRRPARWWVPLVIAVVVAAVGSLWVWRGGSSGREVDALAARVASSLAGRWQPDTFVATSDADPAAERDRLLRPLRDVDVTVEPVGTVVADDAGSVQLRWTWEPGHDREPWVYTTSVRVESTPDGWRARWAPAALHRALAAESRLVVERTPAPRGEVIGVGDRRLVHQRAVERIGIDMTLVDRAAALESGAAMASVLEIDPEPVLARIRAASDVAFIEVASLRTGEFEQRTRLQELRTLPGFRRIVDERPLALTPDFARPLLGTVGEATAEIIGASGGEVVEGDLVGLSGLQKAQDARLRGLPGLVIAARHADGTEEELYRADPTRGSPLHVTLDADVQQRADAAVAVAPGASALVVMRIADGHVLAASSGPGGGGASTATRARIPFSGEPPPQATATALGWGIEDAVVPLFLGSAADRWVSPAGVAGVAASAETGWAVRPLVVLDDATPATHQPLAPDERSAVEAFATSRDAHPAWAIDVREGLVLVAYADGIDAEQVLAAYG